MAKKKKERFPYKFIRPDQLEDLQKMSNDELIKEHLKENKHLRALKRQRKEDPQILELVKEIKDHRENHEDMQAIKEKQAEIKEMRKTMDLEIIDTINDKKELAKGWNDTIKAHQERADVIFKLLDDRGRTK